MRFERLQNIILSAIFLSVGLILPFFTAQLKEIGDTLLPMHIPVMLCGLVCGAKYGFFIGFILPFLRSVLFGMPAIFPNSVWMAFELATYGFVIGLLYRKSTNKSIRRLYICLIVSMLSGRIVWAVVKTILLMNSANPFTFSAFLTGGFLDAIPGIILQLILIPFVMGIINERKKRSV